MVLLGFAFGWALLAVLSVRFTDQPQRWAVAPAVFFAVAGLISLLPTGSVVQKVFGWVWPPLLLGLVVWMIIRARRQLRSRTRRWIVYPLLTLLALASIGGGYETVRESIDATAYPPPGQLIDVGGHRLHLNCTGSGSPTVVLEPGLGEVSPAMGWIAPVVAGVTPGSACTTVRVEDGAILPTGHRTPPKQPPICTHCWIVDTFPGRTCSPVTPSAASTSSPSPPPIPTRLPAWCCWTPPHRYPVRSPNQGRVLRPRRSHLRVAASRSSPRCRPSDR